jgi:iron complex outermembrane receptor protein
MRSNTPSPRAIGLRSTTPAAVVSSIIALACAARQAGAQQAPTAPSAGSSSAVEQNLLQQVVVTGSYIRQNPEEVASPIVTMGHAELQSTGITNLSQVTNYLSANYGSVGGVQDLTKGGGADDRNTRSANLRGLGPSATLVLLNGHRVASQEADSTGNNYVNLATLVPLIEVSRVETVLDGASALYGSDAIAGVMNFITDTSFSGFRSSARYNYVEDSPGWDFEAEAGGGGDRTHIVASIDYQTQGHLQNSQRSWTNFQNLSGGSQPGNFILTSAPVAAGGGDVVINNGVNGPIDYTALYDSTVAAQTAAGKANPTRVAIADPWCDLAGTGGIFIGARFPLGTCAFSYQGQNPLMPGFDQVLTHALATIALDDRNTLSLETRFYYQDNQRWGVPSFSQTNGGAVIPASAPYNPFGVPVTIGNFRALGNAGMPAAGIAGTYNIEHTRVYGAHVVLGASGDLWANWRYSADAEFSRDTSVYRPNDTYVASFQNALDGFGGPSCTITASGPLGTEKPGVAPCYYFNPFGNGELTNPAQTLFNVRQSQFIQTTVTYEIAEASINGHVLPHLLPGGPVGLAIGGQVRTEKREIDTDAVTATGGFGFNPQVQPGEGARHITAAFVETLLPLLPSLDLDAAVRHEDYGDFQNTTHKVGLNWRALSDSPLGDLTLRASTSTSFRAPALAQSTGTGQTGNVGQTTDPLNPQLPVQFRSIYVVSNPNLKPETSTSYNLGATWQPIRDLKTTLDYWKFDYRNQIALQNAQATINANPSGPAVIRDPTGALLGVDVTYFNAGHTSTDGLDIQTQYRRELAGGNVLTASAQFTHLLSYVIQLGPGMPSYDTVGRANESDPGWPAPAWNGSLVLALSHGNASAQITQHFTSGVGFDFDAPPPKPPTEQLASWHPLDWQVRYAFGGHARYDVVLGMINAFNRAPPFAPFAGYIPEIASAIGRESYIQLDARL